MPTGYTYPIEEQDDYPFRTFALQCARAFGALISMRDSPMDEEIPDEIAPSTWHSTRAEDIKKKIEILLKLTGEECSKRAREEFETEVKSREEYNAKELVKKLRYLAMRSKVEEWDPPSEILPLKKFMLDQIDESLKFVVPMQGKANLLSGPEWVGRELSYLQRDLSFHERAQKEENERAVERTKWIRALKESLG